MPVLYSCIPFNVHFETELELTENKLLNMQSHYQLDNKDEIVNLIIYSFDSRRE